MSGNEDENFTFDRSFHKKNLGLGSFLSEFRSSSNEEPDNDNKLVKTDAELRRLCDVTPVNVDKASSSNRPEDNHEFYCHICDVSCNSELMLEAHFNGKQHRKKAAKVESANDSLPQQHQLPQHPVDKHDLRELVKSCPEPVVGLAYVEEVFAESQTSVQSGYYCMLCQTKAYAQNMLSHVLGVKHRNQYFHEKFAWPTLDSIQAKIKAAAVEKSEGKEPEKIRIVCSDKKYPWPPGKEPLPTTDQQQGCDNNQEDVVKVPFKLTSHLISRLYENVVSSSSEAEMAFQAVSALVSQMINYKTQNVASQHLPNLVSCKDNLLQSLATVMNIPTQQSNLYQRRDGSWIRSSENEGAEAETPLSKRLKTLAGNRT